jgi:hypothetical protein
VKKETLFKLLAFLVLSVAFQILLFELYGRFRGPINPAAYTAEGEMFDPSLMRLNNMDRLLAYCDSVYGKTEIAPQDSGQYANIVGRVLQFRFYHSYSYYRLGQNFIGWAMAPAIHVNLSAIVIPDDILKHPNAACSQQSIIGMELLKRKGYPVRKVGFYDPAAQAGHFCFEAFYEGKWHFFDPNKEPTLDILERLDRPSIAELTSDLNLLDAVYHREDSAVRRGYLLNYTYGPENNFPAKKARIYQIATKFFSYTLFFWLLLAGWWLGKWYSKRNQPAESAR